MTNLHRTGVRRSDSGQAADPAARQGKRAYNALSASSVGVEIGLSVGIGLLIGYYMDQWLGTQPWLMLLWLVFGSVLLVRNGEEMAAFRLSPAAR